jgi:hypothetical protein
VENSDDSTLRRRTETHRLGSILRLAWPLDAATSGNHTSGRRLLVWSWPVPPAPASPVRCSLMRLRRIPLTGARHRVYFKLAAAAAPSSVGIAAHSLGLPVLSCYTLFVFAHLPRTLFASSLGWPSASSPSRQLPAVPRASHPLAHSLCLRSQPRGRRSLPLRVSPSQRLATPRLHAGAAITQLLLLRLPRSRILRGP